MNLDNLVKNIIKPNDLNYIKISYEEFKNSFLNSFYIKNDHLFFIIKLSYNKKIKLFQLLNWFYEINNISKIKFNNWDDNKEFDFQENQTELYLTFNMNIVYNENKNINLNKILNLCKIELLEKFKLQII